MIAIITLGFATSTQFWCMWLAVSFGVLVGAAEILSRYRDEPFLALLTRPGLSYLLLNGLTAAGAYGMLYYYGDRILKDISKDPVLMGFVAGFGAMTVMRSKLFSFKTDRGEEFAVGPDVVISTFLRSVDRKIDRNRSARRQSIVLDEVAQIKDPKQLAPTFLTTSLASYQNLTQQEKKDLADAVKELQAQKLHPQVLLMAICFGFLNITGQENFSLLMSQLKAYLKEQEAAAVPPIGGEA